MAAWGFSYKINLTWRKVRLQLLTSRRARRHQKMEALTRLPSSPKGSGCAHGASFGETYMASARRNHVWEGPKPRDAIG